jgi:hypothetical protein
LQQETELAKEALRERQRQEERQKLAKIRHYEREAKVFRGHQRDEEYRRTREAYISWKSQPT